ncbi:TonB-dependent receptor [Bacteroides thetaiotaomicron]|uniref:TonB-dependent receptor n=1 Tax=Bacteroides thetaiotaomicron TaxID=818 RepID=UPI0018A17DFF|nr:TonB-dependent receptor [Bacteroides thetaiotaomicron]MDC2232911.1 TonB-dependent receptor [Bacteroides thetaiotaomicron]
MRTIHQGHLPVRTLVLIGMVILITAQAYAQNANARLTITLRNATLKEFVKLIENSTGYSFIYSEEISISHKINLKVKDMPLHEILDLVFKDEPISYKFSEKYILLQKKRVQKLVSRKFTISGYVTDGTSSETLIGTNIIESHQYQGTTTNPYGFYSITLPEGETELRFSYLGYTTETHHFTLAQDTLLNIRMKGNAQLEEVVVVSDKAEAGTVATQMGAVEIPMVQIKNTPSILGESDVMKAIQLMPGVQAGVDGSAGLYIRGGSPDQNLILLDGTPVYNVDHMFGFFSVFTPEAIKKVTLFKSSFPARFGGRLSSVIDVRTNDGDMKKYHGTLSIGLLTSKINLEGPIVKDKTSFNISARRSYIDLIAKPFMPDDEKYNYYFYDINAKINHKFSDRSRLYLSAYNGKDHFATQYDDNSDFKDGSKMNWGNTIISARWNYIFNNRLFSNTTVSYNNYLFNVSAYSNNQYSLTNNTTFINRYSSDYRSGINDWNYQIDFDYNPSPMHHIKFGAGYIYHRFRPEVMTSKISDKVDSEAFRDTTYHSMNNSRIYAHEVSAYAEDNLKISTRLRLNLGLHFSLFQVQKQSYFSLQPRVSTRYQLSKDVILKASYTKMSQYVHLLSSMPIAMPTDLWVPVTKKIKPMRSHQYSLGGYYTGIKGWEFSVEGYYKDMYNVLEYKDGVSFFGSSTGWESKVEMGKGRSMGIEFMAQKTLGKTTGWLSYTLSKSDRKFAKGAINNGERFPYKYDRRHNINLTLNHKFSERIDIGASWVFYTGGTSTIPEEKTTIIRPGNGANNGFILGFDNYYNPIYNNSPNVGEANYIEHRNNYRLPASHRLNIGINFNKKTKHGMRIWNISLYNAYNSMNPAWVFRSHNDDGKSVIKKYTLLPCIPSFTYTYKF